MVLISQVKYQWINHLSHSLMKLYTDFGSIFDPFSGVGCAMSANQPNDGSVQYLVGPVVRRSTLPSSSVALAPVRPPSVHRPSVVRRRTCQPPRLLLLLLHFFSSSSSSSSSNISSPRASPLHSGWHFLSQQGALGQ